MYYNVSVYSGGVFRMVQLLNHPKHYQSSNTIKHYQTTSNTIKQHQSLSNNINHYQTTSNTIKHYHPKPFFLYSCIQLVAMGLIL